MWLILWFFKFLKNFNYYLELPYFTWMESLATIIYELS